MRRAFIVFRWLSGSISNQPKKSRAFYGYRKFSLVFCTKAGFMPRINFCLRTHEFLQSFRVFIVNNAASGSAKKALFSFLWLHS